MAPVAFHYAQTKRKGKAISQSSMPSLETRSKAGRPTRDQAEARQVELLMFLERGFELTTMEGVAAAVGMTKRTIYVRYEDKAALFKATVRRAIDRATVQRERFEALDTGELETTLIAFARMRVAHFQGNAGMKLQRIINTESFRFPEIFSWYLLHRYESAGAVCIGDPVMAANAFMSLVVGGPVRIIGSGNFISEGEIEARIQYSVRLFLNGARPR
jgi:TetR/AcrR family transcriptional regulator, mexJK operon transcriptional repressor